jgi:hypothetical protein
VGAPDYGGHTVDNDGGARDISSHAGILSMLRVLPPL